MRIKVIKPHATYEIGEHEVTEERGKYLVSMQVAEVAGEDDSVEYVNEQEEEYTEDEDHNSTEKSNVEPEKVEVKKRGRKKKEHAKGVTSKNKS